ncbi:cag pathogenicity island protein, partial [Helicobacter pylori]
LDWFKDSMKNILIWFINNLFILVLAIPILLFGVLALLAFNLTITPSVAIQNINQGGLGIDSTIASLITLFILKGFIETIIESVNAIVNTIFSSVSMDGSRMDRERDALMIGRVGGSMFKG